MLAHIPRGGDQGGNQSAGKNSSGLQRGNAENLRRMRLVVAPLINNVENLRAGNSAQHHQNAQVPGLVAVNAKAFGVAHANPKAKQHSHGNQEAVSGQKKASEMN